MICPCAGCGIGQGNADAVTASVKCTSDISKFTSMEVTADMFLGLDLSGAFDAGEESTGLLNAVKLFAELRHECVNAVRIPIGLEGNLDSPDNTFDAALLKDLHDVVDAAMAEDMYVVLALSDIELENTEEFLSAWTQLAASFSDYSEKVLFESAVNIDFGDVSPEEAYTSQNELNQQFVDTVRNSGGMNIRRHLVIADCVTPPEKSCSPGFRMPSDKADRCIAAVRYYAPLGFCVTGEQNEWGSEDETALMRSDVQMLKDSYINCGIPVIVDEYTPGAGSDASSRVYYAESFVKLCKDSGIPCFMHDNGSEYDRNMYSWNTDGMFLAVFNAAAGVNYIVEKK